MFKQPRSCDCGYVTANRGNWYRHGKTCKHIAARHEESDIVQLLREQLATVGEQLAVQRDQLASRDEQLASRDEQMREQLAAKDEQLRTKDEQIAALLAAAKAERKRPRTVQNNQTILQNVNINAFGQESMDHIKESTLRELLKDPASSIVRLVKLKHSIPENRNVRVRNKRERWVERVVQTADGVKKWEAADKDEVISELLESTATQLVEAADEETKVGRRYEDWHDRLLTSANDYYDGNKVKGKFWKDQMDLVHRSVAEMTR